MSRPLVDIRLESLSEWNRDLIARSERTGGAIRLLNLTLDHGVPCILSVLAYERQTAPALVFAASAALNPEEAVRKSLEELAHTHRAAARLKAQPHPFVPLPDYSNVTDQETHIRLYTEHPSRRLTEFLFSSEDWCDFEELPDLSDNPPEEGLRRLVSEIAARNHQVFVKDLTTADVKDLGLSVVRAVIPGFHPDPSVCRVGDEYVLVTSTFTYFPGVAIFRSPNLVDWTQIGSVLDRESQLDLERTSWWSSLGIHAPTIRHHGGRLWVITTNRTIDEAINFLVTASTPEGPWSEPVPVAIDGWP